MTREGIGNSKMAEDRAVRLSYIALFFHNIGAAVVLALWVAVVILHRPGWLIWLALPTTCLSIGMQLLTFRAENEARDAQPRQPRTDG